MVQEDCDLKSIKITEDITLIMAKDTNSYAAASSFREMFKMHIESWEEAIHKDNRAGLGGLTVKCPICGREFGCNKTCHVYTALVGRKRQYYCSYSCYKQRPNPKEKR